MYHWQDFSTRYVGDANANRVRHVHDLANEKRSCTIHAIEWARNTVPFATRDEAFAAGYKPCIFCMPSEKGAN